MQSFSLLGQFKRSRSKEREVISVGRSWLASALRVLRCVKPTVEEAMHGSFDGVCMAALQTCIREKIFPVVGTPNF